MEYPTYRGIAIPTSDIELPESRLDLTRSESFNNHHREWTARKMGQFLITQTLRDLEFMQDIMPRDVHQRLHEMYEPPRFPTIEEAMGRIAMAHDTGERLKIWIPGTGYVYHDLTHIHWLQVNQEFNRLAA